MRQHLIILLLLLLCFIIQTTLLPFLAVYNISPDFILIFVTAISMLNGQWEGMIFGIIAGILMDIFYSPIFGIYSLIYATIGFFVGKISKNIFKENPFAALLFTISDSVYKGIVVIIVKAALSYKTGIGLSFLALSLPEALLNGIIIFLAYDYLVILNDQIMKKRNKTIF